MDLQTIRLVIPENGNIIVGQSHFIKTVEDLYEAIVNTVPQMKFGIAFNEASGACLTRVEGKRYRERAINRRRPHFRDLDARWLPDQRARPHPRDPGTLHHLLRDCE